MHVALENLLNWGQVDRVSVDLLAALIKVKDGPTLCLTWLYAFDNSSIFILQVERCSAVISVLYLCIISAW